MIKVRFYDTVPDTLLKFAVMISKYQDQWVFVKHRQRDTFECPGGRREAGESISQTAQRELWEETGAVQYYLEPVCAYSVCGKDGRVQTDEESFGMLYYAEIFKLGPLPELEIEKIECFTTLPDRWTYPQIQPLLLEKARLRMQADNCAKPR